MKKIMKKNQVIITGLAVLIAVAGYLNFADVNLTSQDKEASTDSSSILDEVDSIDYDLSDQIALMEENSSGSMEEASALLDDTDTPGEAILTGATNFAAQAKLSREQIRSQNKADLQAIIDNQELSQEQKQEAVNTMVSMTEMMEKEAAAELLLEAKGFENVIVNLTGETADIVVPDSALEDAKRAQIEDIVKRKTGVSAENIVITPLSQASDESDTQDTEEDSQDTSAQTDAYEGEDVDGAETWSDGTQDTEDTQTWSDGTQDTEDTQTTSQQDGSGEDTQTWSEDTVADYDYTQDNSF